MKNVNETISKTLAQALTNATRKDEGGRKATQAAYDLAVSEGYHWTQWIPVGKECDGHQSTATPELRAELQVARAKGLSASAVKLLNIPTKALSDAKKKEKRDLSIKLNKYMTDDRNAMRLRQDKAYRDSKSKKAPQQPIHVVKSDDPVVNESNKVNAKICKKIRDLQTYIEGNAPVKSANDTRELLRKALELFSQQH